MHDAIGEALVRLIDPADSSPREMLNNRGSILLLVTPALGARSSHVQLVTIRPSTPPGPKHLHTVSENILYVLEGEVRVQASDLEYSAGPGQAIFIPPKTPHSVSNAGAAILRMLEIYAPGDADFVLMSDG